MTRINLGAHLVENLNRIRIWGSKLKKQGSCIWAPQPEFPISDVKGVLLPLDVGESTFHKRDLFPTFRETVQRVRVSLLHWPFLKNKNNQYALMSQFRMGPSEPQ